MNNAHLHLIVNHLPIIFPIVGLIILLIGVFTKSEISKRNAYFVFILGAVASVAAMATGEGAEETIEHLQGISENLIHRHEEAAEIFAGLSYFLGAVALLGLLLGKRNLTLNKFVSVTVLLVASASMYFAQEAGRTGGEIRHTEIRHSASVQPREQTIVNQHDTEEEYDD